MKRQVASVASVAVVAAAVAGLFAGAAGAADECKGLRVCLPVTGPWVVVSTAGVDYELACPLAGYVVGGTDARVAAKDVDVSFRGETGSPVSGGVTTHRSVTFHAARVGVTAGTTSFQPFLGCIPTNGGGGRSLTVFTAANAGIKPTQVLFAVVANKRIASSSQTVRVACPSNARLVGASHAIAFRQKPPPSSAQRAAIRVTRTVTAGAVVARVVAAGAAGPRAEVQLRAVCTRAR